MTKIYKAIIKPVFEVDITDWNDEDEPNSKMLHRVKAELEDFSVFMLHADYENLKDVKVTIVEDLIKDSKK